MVKKRPELQPASVFWWEAFCDLDYERGQHGLIPPRAVREYADRWQVPYWRLRCIIEAMDKALRDRRNG